MSTFFFSFLLIKSMFDRSTQVYNAISLLLTIAFLTPSHLTNLSYPHNFLSHPHIVLFYLMTQLLILMNTGVELAPGAQHIASLLACFYFIV